MVHRCSKRATKHLRPSPALAHLLRCPIFFSTATSLGSLGLAFPPLALHVKKKIMFKEGKEQILTVWT